MNDLMIEDLGARLDAVAVGAASTPIAWGQVSARPRGKLAFVFSGQGSQWPGMGRQLFAHEPVFRAALERCDEEVRARLAWSVIEELFAAPAAARLDDIDVVQPAIFAVQVALAALWRSWGIVPDVVIGHSQGELAAAHVAGALSLPDAAGIMCARSRVTVHPCTRGAMAVIGLPASAVEAVIAPVRDRVWIAIHESPESTVIAGDPRAIDEVVAEVLARDVFGRRIKALVAAHSPRFDPLRDPLLDLISAIRPQAASVRLQSTVDLALDAQAGDGAALGPAYWWRNLRQPVLFAQAMRTLIAEGVDTFVEISPHPILGHAMAQCAKHAGASIAALASTRRGEDERPALLSSLAALHAQGREVDRRVLGDGLAVRAAASGDASGIGAPGAGVGPPQALAALLAAAEGEREDRVEALLTHHLARVLGRPAAQLRPDVGLHHLGLESLMALEFRNRIRADLDVVPPLARLVGSDVSLRALGRDILDQLAAAARAPAPSPAGARAAYRATALGTDELTDDQVRALLREIDGDG
jgi:malonyl CoA-acyl carrier protein transacylase